jgi:hypothetical protein
LLSNDRWGTEHLDYPVDDFHVVELVSPPLHGEVDFTYGLYYQAHEGYFGEDSFQYVIRVGPNTSAPATVRITVRDWPQEPYEDEMDETDGDADDGHPPPVDEEDPGDPPRDVGGDDEAPANSPLAARRRAVDAVIGSPDAEDGIENAPLSAKRRPGALRARRMRAAPG